MIRRLPTLALLMLLLIAAAHAQSLADVARDTRENQQKNAPERVITNGDLVKSSPAPHDTSKPTLPQATERHEASDRKDAAADLGRSQIEKQKNSEEINRRYRERIANLREQINSAEAEVTRLQGDFVNRQAIWERYEGTGETHFRDLQAMAHNQQVSDLIEAQQKLITSLKSRLAETQEEARHAGVPHATD